LSNQWYNLAKQNQSFDFMVLSDKQMLFDPQKGIEKEKFPEFAEQCKTVLQTKENGKVLRILGKLCAVSVEQNEKSGWFLVQYMPISKL
ncbi:hypothetical protein, partial [Acinetobacter baumannii]|uniref:hypothetical protein n=1 Tax=Acinetobacter baumannii TaxID=470 RepID=UPI0031F3F795